MSAFGRQVFAGAVAGVVVATAFSGWVTLQRLLSGATLFDRIGISYPVTVAYYYVVLPLGGALLGALWSLRRHLLGAVLLGVLLAAPLYFGAAILLRKPSDTWLADLRMAVILSVVGGASVGIWNWWDERKESSGPRS